MATLIDDLSGSLAPEKDYVLPTQPAEPEMRESVSVLKLFEENGAFGFPRMGHSRPRRRVLERSPPPGCPFYLPRWARVEWSCPRRAARRDR